MTNNKRYTSKKYNDYPVIVDNQNNEELTLDSVVNILNTHEFNDKLFTKEHNQLYEKLDYLNEITDNAISKRNQLWKVILVLVIVIMIETYYLIL